MQRQNESKPLLENQYPNYSEAISSTKEKKVEKEKGKGKEKETDSIEKNDLFDYLPNEDIEHIVKFLKLKDLLLFMRVNKRINEITQNTPAGDVLDLREKIFRAKKEIENINQKTISTPDGPDIENPDEEKSFSFKNKDGKQFTTGDVLSSMQKCLEWSEEIPKLSESADRANERASCLGEMVSSPLIPGTSLLGGCAVGTGIGLGLNYGCWGGNYTNLSALAGLAGGGLLGCVGTVTTLVCIYAGFSFFSSRKSKEAHRLQNEISSDISNQLITQIVRPKTTIMAK